MLRFDRALSSGLLPFLAACAGPDVKAGDEAKPAAAAAVPAPPIPRPEHPDPSFVREPWANLNGTWEFDFDPDNAGLKEQWFVPGRRVFTKRIVVPFPWESELSGLSAVGYRGAGWYRRTLAVDPAWTGQRVFLRFGAVDWSATAWINGNKLPDHEGGYTPFEYDITEWLKRDGGNELVVRAHDTIDRDVPTGKQTGWYTPTSGIWQTVWLEARPATHIERIEISPEPDQARARIRVSVASTGGAPGEVALSAFAKGASASAPGATGKFRMDKPRQTFDLAVEVERPVRWWSPDSPHLYDLDLKLESSHGMDAVRSYFGMRTVTTGKLPGRDYEYIFLNGKPIYLLGALNQSFNPKGIYTFPTDADIRRDVEISKECGLNFLRIHIKTDEPRLYYWADKLGLLMMCDVPSPWEDTPRMRRTWEETFRGMVARDFNHPCIFSWVLFNETWGLTKHRTAEGQRWLEESYRMAKSVDPTRLIEDNSPCNWDHVATDINSWHFYINDYEGARDHIREVVEKTQAGSTFNYVGGYKQGTAPLINSEYGGIGAGSGDQDVSWCFKFLTNELRKHPKICGYVYTELMDIEWEHNGFVNYDRTPKDFGYGDVVRGMTLRDLNSPDFVVIDAPPCVTVPAGGTFEADLLVSHWSDRDLSKAKVVWQLCWAGMGKGGLQPGILGEGRMPADVAPYDVGKAGRVKVSLPKERALLTLVAWLEAPGVGAFARNFIAVNVEAPSWPRMLARNDEVFFSFRPVECFDYAWPLVSSNVASGGDKLCGYGAGWFEYRLRVPDNVPLDSVKSVAFRAELSAKALDQKLAWPARRNPGDYPQTDVVTWPTDVTISVNGCELGTETLPDDPADARGAQTHTARHHPGSYGWIVSVHAQGEVASRIGAEAAKDRLLRVRLEVKPDAKHPGGLAVFGEKLGRFTCDPRLTLHLSRSMTGKAVEADAAVALAAATFGSAAAPSEWLVIGPFDNPDRRGFAEAYPPEAGIDLAADVPTKAGPARWRKVRARHASAGQASPRGDVSMAQLNFLPLFRPNEYAVAYAVVHAKVPAPMEAKLVLGSDDGVKVWVNGELVHQNDVYRGLNAEDDRASVKLKAGWNRLLFKVTQGMGGWDLAARLTTAAGGAIEGLAYDAYGDLPR